MSDIYVTVQDTPNETVVITTPVNVTVGAPSFIAGDYVTTGYVETYYYPRTNPSGYLTAALAGGIQSLIVNGTVVSGIVTFSGSNGVSITTGLNNTLIWSGNGSSSTNTGELTGAFYPRTSNPSGYVTGSIVRPNETGNFVTIDQTGSFGANTGSLTGIFYPLNTNPSGYLNNLVVRTTGTQIVSGIKRFIDHCQFLSGLDVQYTDFSGIQPPPWQEGRVFYDTGSHTLAYYNEISDITVNVGQEQLVRVRNGESFTIPDGRGVFLSGAQGTHPLVWLADGSSTTSDYVLGLTTHNLVNDGYVTTFGLVHGLDTRGMPEGTKIYLDGSGRLTGSPLPPPAHRTLMGYSFYEHQNQGIIFVNPQIGEDIAELHNVRITGLLSGQALIYNNANLLWENQSVVFPNQTGIFITTGQTGSFVSNTGVLTGVFYPLNSNPSGYVTGSVVRPTETGLLVTNNQLSGFITTGNADVRYALASNTGQFVTTSQTGAFYPLTGNPAGYVTGNVLRSSDTGNLADRNYVNTVSGVISDRLVLTGSDLLSLIQAASAGVSSLNGASGIVNILGAGNVNVSALGQNITISGNTGIYSTFVTTGQTGSFGGGNTGVLTGEFYPLHTNPSGYITGNQVLGLPTDGAYGGANGAIAGVSAGDRGEDAFDKIEVILGKLAPSKPFNLSSSSWIFLNTTYGAKMQGTNTSYSGIMNSLTPTGRATGFYDGDAGILSGNINNILTGSKTLSSASDTGNFSGLRITGDFDFWSGVAGKAGFWSALSAIVTPTTNLSTGQFTMMMGHSTTGPTATLTGYCNQVQTPVTTILSIQTGASVTRIIDGVPALATNDPINVQFQVTNAISAFYAPNIGNISSSHTSTTSVAATGTPLSGETQTLSGIVTVSASRFATGWTGSVFSYNAVSGVSTTATSVSNIRIDTVSTQPASRVRAGTDLYASNFGATYDNNLSLVSGEELQLINGLIQNPPKINYTVVVPAGPDYRSIQTGLVGGQTGVRWACFNMGTITADSSITLTFNSSNNFGASVLVPGLYLYAKVSGSSPTAGWINCNGAYPGVGNPTNDGDLALVVGSSTSTVKVVTFGSTTRDGSVFVRVGLPSGSNKSFASLTMT